MTDDQPVVDGEFKLGVCPRCTGPLLTTRSGSVCWLCAHVDIALRCDTCGGTGSWQPPAALPCWVRVFIPGLGDDYAKVWIRTYCCAACAVIAIDKLTAEGKLAVAPSTEPPGPAA